LNFRALIRLHGIAPQFALRSGSECVALGVALRLLNSGRRGALIDAR
jgi:hypothetical protein